MATATQTQTDIIYEVKDGIATITLNRPERNNAWTLGMKELYFDLLDRAAADPDVRVIVLTGAGKSFSVGADIENLKKIDASTGIKVSKQERPVTYALSIPKPIIAAINGACAGIAFVYASFCDIRFAAAGAKFTTAFVRRGLVAEHGVSWMLPRLIGPSKALDLLLSGRVFLAEEAAELGFVNRVVPRESLMDTALAYARDMADNCSPTAMARIKKQVYEDYNKTLPEALNLANELMDASARHPDLKEGVMSFAEKRPPIFQPLSTGE